MSADANAYSTFSCFTVSSRHDISTARTCTLTTQVWLSRLEEPVSAYPKSFSNRPPAKEAFESSVICGQSFMMCVDRVDRALHAAQEGTEQTIGMRSRAGRAGWLGDRTVGEKDPGAAAFVLLLKSAKDFISQWNHRTPSGR